MAIGWVMDSCGQLRRLTGPYQPEEEVGHRNQSRFGWFRLLGFIIVSALFYWFWRR